MNQANNSYFTSGEYQMPQGPVEHVKLKNFQ